MERTRKSAPLSVLVAALIVATGVGCQTTAIDVPKSPPVIAIEGPFDVTIDYPETPEQLASYDEYDSTSVRVAKEFFRITRLGSADIEVALVGFSLASRNWNDVVVALEKENLRPAEMPELFSFVSVYPQKRYGTTIIALGSSLRDGMGDNAPCFHYGERGMTLGYCADVLTDSSDKFIAVQQ